MKTMFMVSALLAVAVLMAIAQNDPQEQELQQIRVELANLGLRVANIEHAGGKSPGPSGTGQASSAAAPARTMVLVSISAANHSGAHAQEISQLNRQVGSLMNTVNASADQMDSDFGQQIYAVHVRGGVRGWGGAVGGGFTTSNVGAVGRQVLADKEVTNRYATQYAIKKQELDSLQHAAAMPMQIIHGHDGNTILTLETKYDLSTALDDIAIGDLVTWTGTRVSADDRSETWRINMIKKVNSR